MGQWPIDQPHQGTYYDWVGPLERKSWRARVVIFAATNTNVVDMAPVWLISVWLAAYGWRRMADGVCYVALRPRA